MPVRVHEKTPVQIDGGVVVVAFPSFGLVATLAAHYLVETLGLQEVGSVESEAFPTLAVVEEGEPMAPLRLYAGTVNGRGIAVFLSEFQPDPPLVREVAQAILDWSRQGGVDLVISPEGLLADEEALDEEVPVEVYCAASNAQLRDRLRTLGAPLFRNGLVAGVTGSLLTAGKRDEVPVVGILAEASPDRPDARSAAAAVDLMAQLLDAELDTTNLYEEADRYAKKVAETMRMQRMHEREPGQTQSAMYG